MRQPSNFSSCRLLNSRIPLNLLYPGSWKGQRREARLGAPKRRLQNCLLPAQSLPFRMHQRVARWVLALVRPRLLRVRKKRCSQMLQRNGNKPMVVRKTSRGLRCDLRTLDSRHFGHVIAMASSLLEPKALRGRYSNGGLSRFSRAKKYNPEASVSAGGYQYDAPADVNSQSGPIMSGRLLVISGYRFRAGSPYSRR